MKKTIFLMFAISILFCSSVSAYANSSYHSHDNDMTYVNISLENAKEEVHNFFYEWNKAPTNQKFLSSLCLSNHENKPPCSQVAFYFYLLDKPLDGNFRLSFNPVYGSDKFFIADSSKLSGKTVYIGIRALPFNSSTTPVFKIFSNTNVSLFSGFPSTPRFGHYHSSVSPPFSTVGTIHYDFNKNTPTIISYDVDITKPWEDPTIPPSSSSEPPPPPSSSSEPPPPPVFPDIDIPSGPTELPPIEVPEVDLPVIVPPYDDEYIWYDPSIWEDFFNNINLNIGKVVNAAIIILALIYSIILVIKVIKYFVRGDDIFDDWQL